MTLKVVPFEAPAQTTTAAPSVSGGGFHVPLVGPDRQDSAYLRASGYDMLETGGGEGFMANAATFLQEGGVLGPVLSELDRRRKLGETTEVWTPYTALGLLAEQQPKPATPMAEADWKESAYHRPGLSYTEGMTTEWAQELAERHDTQAKRADIVARSSAWETVPGAIAGSLVDPIGLAANFVPIVSEARYVAMAARMGRFGARAATGLVEGAVGQAMLEPFIYQAAKGDQRDYDFTDSLSNVALGGLFGAGLHVGLGGVGDLLRRRGVQAHVEAGDIAVRQAALGQEIDVRPALRHVDMEPSRRVDVPEMRRPEVEPTRVEAEAPAQIAPISESEIRGRRDARGRFLASKPAPLETGPLTVEQRQVMVERAFVEQFPTQDVRTGAGGTVRRSGPMDIVSWLRTKGGLKDDPEIAARDFKEFNKGRPVQFAKGERFLGRLVDNERGMSLEQAAVAAAENGYIRPQARGADDVNPAGVPELLEAVERTLRAGESLEGRAWRETDFEHIQAYSSAARGLDEEAHINPMPQRGLGGAPKPPPGPVEDDYFFDPIDDVDGMDDPEALLAEAEEWAGAGRMEQPETVASGAAKGIAEVKGPDGRRLWEMTREEFLRSRPRTGRAEVVEGGNTLGLKEEGPPGMLLVDREGSSIRRLVARGADGRIEGVVAYNWNDAANETWMETLKREGKPEADIREEASTLSVWIRQDRRGAGLADQMYDALQAKGVNIDAMSGWVTTEAGAKFAHQRAVRRASEAGLPVPENVLADYADLPPAKPGMKMGEAVDMTDPVVKAERYGAAVKAMAACMAGVAA